MIIKIPVECQNGHRATWRLKIVDLKAEVIGVDSKDKCNCPKWGLGQGYHATGDPEVDIVRERKSFDSVKEVMGDYNNES